MTSKDHEKSTKRKLIDEEISRKLRLIRVESGLTQGGLAEKIGVTLQQIQKYESGKTKISASKLYALATALGKRPSWFYDEIDPSGFRHIPSNAPEELRELKITPEIKELIECFYRIDDAKFRKAIIWICMSLAEQEEKSADNYTLDKPDQLLAQVAEHDPVKDIEPQKSNIDDDVDDENDLKDQ